MFEFVFTKKNQIMPSTTTTHIYFLLLSLLCTATTRTTATTNRHRHLLHQPFFPLTTTAPPTQSPSPSPQPQPQAQQPKYPFSSTTPNTPQKPFFPTLPSPPPPPPLSTLATFPANISSLFFPRPPSSSSSFIRKHLIISLSLSLSLLLAAVLAALSAFLIYSRRHHHHKTAAAATKSTTSKSTSRISESLRLFPPNTLPSDSPPNSKPPKIPHRPGVPSTSSSEFLYLGTLANPYAPEYQQKLTTLAHNVGVKIGVSSSSTTTSSSPYQKLGSPELRPLPPLPKHNYTPTYRSGEVLINPNNKDDDTEVEEENGEEDEEKFYSPRGSSGRKESLESPVPVPVVVVRNGSSSRNDFRIQGDNFLGSNRSFNSRTASYPLSNSCSPPSNNNSLSASPSQASNLSHKGANSDEKSPETIVSFAAVVKRSSPPSVSSSSLSSPTSSLSSPKGRDASWNVGNSPSPERISSHSGFQRRVESVGVKQSVAPVRLPPPPPPPPPPPRFWEVPVGELDLGHYGRPPVIVMPSKPVVVQNLQSFSAEEPWQGNACFERDEETPKLKLKPLHWDKVRASSDRAMVWDQIKSSSFQLNEEMIETLFMVNNSNLNPKDNSRRRQSFPLTNQENRVLDPKKSQNISILLRALNVTIDEVCEALLEGNSDSLGTELLESFMKMAPTKEEEQKLKEFKDESPNKLGPAERFLKAVLDIPFAFKRVDAMIYIANFDSEVKYLRRSFETLEAACGELKNSRMFLKLLEAVLKTGNRMNVGTNRGDAQAFKLDTLLKLVDVKGTDGKTTLLHFVVQEIIRSEGLRLCDAAQNVTAETSQQSAFQDDVQFRKLGLQVVSGLSGELTNVKKAAAMDSDVLSNEVARLSTGIMKVREVLKLNEGIALKETSRKFSESMMGFLNKAAEDIMKIQAQEKVALSLVKEITEYFHGNSAKEEAHPFRIFMVVRDFLSILDRVCKEVGKINERSIYYSIARPTPVTPEPGLNGRQQCNSSDDERPSLM